MKDCGQKDQNACWKNMNINKITLESYENRQFELKVAEYLDKKIVNPPVYLSVGTEHIPVILKSALDECGISDYAIFPQHRCHSYYLTFSKNKEEAMRLLSKELCGRTDGCGEGMTGSASLHVPGIMFGHDGLLGSNAAIACGYAQATGKTTICILGDAACEEDYVLGAIGYATTHKLPVLFLVENNGLSILTDIPTRRNWDICGVAHEMGCNVESYHDEYDGWGELYTLIKYLLQTNRPALLESHVCRHLWHAGSGNDGPPRWDSLNEAVEYFKDEWYPTRPLGKIEERVSNIWKELNV